MFIILEGLPGTGKTTLSRNLAKKFKGVLIPQIILRFPKNYKNLSLHEKEKFFMKNDLEKYKKALKTLKNKKWVIMDRGVFSTFAYNYALTRLKQGNTYKMTVNWYKKNKKTFNLPQIIIFFKTSLNNSLKRKRRLIPKTSKKNSPWRNRHFLKEMEIFYQNFLPKFQSKDIQVIKVNSNQPLKEIFRNICKKLNAFKK